MCIRDRTNKLDRALKDQYQSWAKDQHATDVAVKRLQERSDWMETEIKTAQIEKAVKQAVVTGW
eukprot:626082-Alexandrium_andersonii.AAC.1